MIYLDYSATTPVDRRVLSTFNKVCMDYSGNSNSFNDEHPTKQLFPIVQPSEIFIDVNE